MNCETLLQYLSDYIDFELDETLSAVAQAHLATCQNCRVMLDSTQRLIVFAKTQGEILIPAARKESLFDQLSIAFSKSLDSL